LDKLSKLSHYMMYQNYSITKLCQCTDDLLTAHHTCSFDNNSRNLSVMSSGPSKSWSGRLGSIQSPCVWQRGQVGSGLSIGWVCSGIVFLGLGSFLVRATLGALGSRLCIRQCEVPGKAPLRHGVPLPVTPWHGDFFWFWSCWSWRRRSATSATSCSRVLMVYGWFWGEGGTT
jgi:hypothetical protein